MKLGNINNLDILQEDLSHDSISDLIYSHVKDFKRAYQNTPRQHPKSQAIIETLRMKSKEIMLLI